MKRARRERVFERDGYRCVACGATEDLTIDHRVPRSRGGSNHISNLQTMCAPCNNGKGDRLPGEPFKPKRRRRPKAKALKVSVDRIDPRLAAYLTAR